MTTVAQPEPAAAPEQPDESLLTITDAATLKIAELLATENNRTVNLRLYIEGGGCSGFKYEFAFDDQVNEDDLLIEKNAPSMACSAKLIIDAMSLQYLIGATIDYISGIEERFIIHNPHAKTTCGCGSSFSVD